MRLGAHGTGLGRKLLAANVTGFTPLTTKRRYEGFFSVVTFRRLTEGTRSTESVAVIQGNITDDLEAALEQFATMEENGSDKKEKPDNRSGLFHTCTPENKVRNNDVRIRVAAFPTSHQFWGQRIIPSSIASMAAAPSDTADLGPLPRQALEHFRTIP